MRAVGPGLARRSWGGALLGSLLVGGCSPDLVSVDLSIEGAQSVVAVYLKQDQVTEVIAVEPPSGEHYLSLPVRPGAAVVALSYHCGLEGLGLSAEGRVAEQLGGVALRRPRRVRTGVGDGMSAGGWQEAAGLPAALASLRLAGTPVEACTEDTMVELSLGTGPLSAALVGSNPLRIAINARNRVLLVDPEQMVVSATITRPRAGLPQISAGSAFTDGVGAAYFLSSSGDFYRLGPDLVLEYSSATTTSTLARTVVRDGQAAGPRQGDAARDIFLITGRGRADHFDGERWSPVDVSGSTEPIDSLAPGVTWLAPGSALFSGATRDTVTLWTQGQRVDERIERRPAVDDLVGTVWLEAFGAPAAITRQGAIWVRRGEGTYTSLSFADAKPTLGRLEAVGSQGHQLSFALGGHSASTQPAAFSRYYQYDEELGPCAQPLQTSLTNVLAILPLGDGRVMLFGLKSTTATGGREVYVLLRLTPTKRVLRCDE